MAGAADHRHVEITSPRRDRPHTASKARSRLVRVGKRLRPWVNQIVARHSLMPNDAVLDPGLFDWTSALEANWQAISLELEQILLHDHAVPPLKDISPDHGRIAGDGKWQAFFLVGYGYWITQNLARAPRTAALLTRIPGLNSAFFSILAPGAHIPLHRGVTKGIVTCHLGLKVPADAARCHMRVGDADVHWQRGCCLVFDDTYPHEVWNETEEVRVALLIQFERPSDWIGRLMTRLFLTGVRQTRFVKDVRRNLGDWELVYRQAERDEAIAGDATVPGVRRAR